MADLEKELDSSKKRVLREINDIGWKMVSHPNKKDKSGWASSTGILHRALGSVAEMSKPNLDDDLGIFGTDKGAAVVEQMGLVVEYVLFGHPFVAYVWDENHEAGILKFVPKGQTEVDVLQYLNAIDSPMNHTVRPIQVRSTSQGTFVHLPPSGGWLGCLRDVDEHLKDTALQLFEAVAFMHKHRVAHLDLKPANIVIQPEYGRLTIIDFSHSIRVKRTSQTVTGLFGTEGYIAPEMGEISYDPIRADLWSCGKVVEELCAHCKSPSPIHEQLVGIAGRLMSPDPLRQPIMIEAVRMLKCSDTKPAFGHRMIGVLKYVVSFLSLGCTRNVTLQSDCKETSVVTN
ncbi:uncharacterized protein FIBRA_01978 [Fibroporia radiculosa]|uniref:Protein kinase domain-containing protein n=1 Tax=Fibroporia radiculosa TaxID=599839 RepID=J4G1A3_9APHY|nr:uncharacterized protein FIBRA_01978 [Fibroporia radiculosa]CCL99953.1 predicted protein [Fibroporia radiculosa]